MIEPQLMFATPIWHLKLDDHEQLNYRLEQLTPMYKTGDNYFEMDDDTIREFKSKVVDKISQTLHWLDWGQPEITLDGRQNPIFPGKADTPHHHPTNKLVAVYYIIVPKESGDLVMHDPRGSIIWQDPKARTDVTWCSSRPFHKITPVPGSLIIFPGYLVHSVETNLSPHMRLSIVIDIYLNDGMKYAR
jgi:uncharacterized protein (TIGR02466 family)